jgi:hypothetical protein
MEKQKLSQEEIQELKEFQTNSNQVIFELGQVDLQKALLEGQRNNILENLAKLQEKQNQFAKELQNKYGEGNIDLESGEFTKME